MADLSGRVTGWIAARMKTAGLTADNDAVTLLAERLEGNLLAASQEIEKYGCCMATDHHR